MTDAIRWAGQAAIHGTGANRIVLAGLRSILAVRGDISIRNPVSSARDGATPDLTRVLLCDVQTRDHTEQFCIKLYPSCHEGKIALHRHALVLSRLKNVLPVPDVIEELAGPDLFGFPALVTTALGRPLDEEFQELAPISREAITAGLAEAVATLHHLNPDGLPVDPEYCPQSVLQLWAEDAEWYEQNAGEAREFAGLVTRGASVLAECRKAPSCDSVVHRDLTPNNVLAKNGAFAAIVDWDHIGFSAPQEDVGKALIGLLGMLSLPRSSRLPLARTFLDAYCLRESLSAEELLTQSVPFALDTLLDWVVGGKNAPRAELSWAVEQILEQRI